MAGLQPQPQTHGVLLRPSGEQTRTSKQRRAFLRLPSSSSHSLIFKDACDTAALLSWSPLGPLQTWPCLLCCRGGFPTQKAPLLALWTPARPKHLPVQRFWKKLVPLLLELRPTSQTVL